MILNIYEFSNIQICKKICKTLNNIVEGNFDYSKLISFVNDRKGHDYRYAIDNTKIIKENINSRKLTKKHKNH